MTFLHFSLFYLPNGTQNIIWCGFLFDDTGLTLYLIESLFIKILKIENFDSFFPKCRKYIQYMFEGDDDKTIFP